MAKDKETQYERTGQIQQREIYGYDLLSRFEEYRKKGTEKPQPRRKRLSIKAKRHIGNIVRKSGLKRMRNGSTATKSAYAGRNKPDLR